MKPRKNRKSDTIFKVLIASKKLIYDTNHIKPRVQFLNMLINLAIFEN